MEFCGSSETAFSKKGIAFAKRFSLPIETAIPNETLARFLLVAHIILKINSAPPSDPISRYESHY